jgi:hypothetical protein
MRPPLTGLARTPAASPGVCDTNIAACYCELPGTSIPTAPYEPQPKGPINYKQQWLKPINVRTG